MTFKRFFAVGAYALAILGLSAGAASADPVSTFLVAAWTATSGAMAVAGFVLKTAVMTGISHLANKLAAPKASGPARQADVMSLQLGEVPREMIVGRAVTGGSLVQAFRHGGSGETDKNTFVIALADELCDGLEGVFVDDQFIAHTADGDVAGSSGGLNIRWRNGAPGQTFPADLYALAGFDADDRLAGVAHVWVTYTAKWVEERGGRPRLRFRVRGGRRYDPRKDSTVPGGSGSHRWATPSTWEWTENLVLNRYAYQRGVFAEGRVAEPEQLLVGRGLSAIEAPPERIIAWANLCDELVALKAGGTEKRWRVGGVIRADESYIAVDERFAAACGGQIIQPEGGIEVEPGHAKAAVVAITDNDLLVGQPVAFNAFLPETERYNTVVVRYVEPAQDWQMHTAPVRRSLTDIADDGGPSILPIDLDLVTSATQAQRVGEIARRKARLEMRAAIPLGPRFSMLERGDWISWTSARWLNGETKTFRITADPLDQAWQMRAALEEVTSAIYSWVAASDEITPGAAPPDLWAPPGALSLSGFGVAQVNKGGRPGLRFTWGTPVDPAIGTVTAEVRIKGQTQVASQLMREPNKGTLDLTNGVAPDTLMEARLVPGGGLDRTIAPTAWIEIGAGILTAGAAIGLSDGVGGVIPPEDLGQPTVYARDRRWDGFASLAGIASSSNVTLVGNSSVLTVTPDGTGSTTFVQLDVNRPGAKADKLMARMRAVSAHVLPAQLDLRATYQTAGLAHSLTRSARGRPRPSSPLTDTKRVTYEFDMSDLPDYLNSTILEVRFYLVFPASPPVEVDWFETGSSQGATANLGALADLDAVSAPQINPGAVLPSKMADALTPSKNRIRDGGLTDPISIAALTNGAEHYASVVDGQLLSVGTPGAIQFNAVNIGGSLTMMGRLQRLEVEPGQMMRFDMRGRFVAPFTGYCFVYLRHYDSRGVGTGGTDGNHRTGVGVGDDWRVPGLAGSTTRAGTWTYRIPTNCKWVDVEVYCVWSSTQANTGRALIGAFLYRDLELLGRDMVRADGSVPTAATIADQSRSFGINFGATQKGSNGKLSPISGQPQIIEVTDGQVFTFDEAFPGLPLIAPIVGFTDPPASGGYIDQRATSVSATGFTARVKKVNPGTSPVYTTRVDDGGGGLVGTAPASALERQKALSGIPSDGKITARGTIRARGVQDVETPGATQSVVAIVKLYARRLLGDAWLEVGYASVVCDLDFASGGTKNFTIIGDVSTWASWNAHGNPEYRLQITQGYLAGQRELTAFTSVTYQELTSGGTGASESSALSGGRKALFEVAQADG